MRPDLRRMQQWAERRLPALTRYRRAEPLPVELHRRRIYIVPTRFGLGFTVLLMVMLVGALNYSNNAALLLTCLLGAACAASMLVAFRTLDGLELQRIHSGHAVAGQPIEIRFDFAAPSARFALRLDMGESSTSFAVDLAHDSASVTLPLPTVSRGWQALPRVRVWTTWPLGLFRAWSWLHPEQSVLVWPQPEAAGPPPEARADDDQRRRLHQGEDPATLRDYRRGDPIRHVAWKASARHRDLLVKDFEAPASRQDWQLDWHQLGQLEHEHRIARLARWLDEAAAHGRHHSLELPGETIERGSGPVHYMRCMDALAKLP
ncbi:DUF58 domain-containing protein [Dyella sp. A6]|uniref:DUF58 domain-containing protein n=1 Tax=Dyella aluminiiresistens TaxID=3069105 RepID=UPI002E7605C7|nr:DUF58 domain-containing protein [Dyella sp. A6]